jgi:hypothetical protein
MNPLRRLVLSSSAFAPLGCATASFDWGIPVSAPKQNPIVRAPQLGQQWMYLKRDGFTSKVKDVIIECVEIVGQQITIVRTNQDGVTLASEIQGPWGSVITDPYWGRTINFSPATPLWPEQLSARYSGFYQTRYQVLGNTENDYYWGLSIDAKGWSLIKVIASEFDVLYFTNTADYFQSDDWFRMASNRREQVWLAPEIGRWVVRESFGEYLWLGMSRWAQSLKEDYLRWELISWK